MNKLLLNVLAVAFVAFAGCDTTETKTLQINLGGSRAVPAGVSTVYVAAFPIDTVGEYPDSEDTLGGIAGVAAVSVGTSSVSLVVPIDIDIFILVLAADSTGSAFFYVGDNIYVSADDNTVQVQMKEPSFYSGDTWIYDSSGIFSTDMGFKFDLVNGRVDMSDLAPYMELHLEESSDGGSSYNVIKRASMVEFLGLQGQPFGVTSRGGRLYRARVYFPVLGLYFYDWGSFSSGT